VSYTCIIIMVIIYIIIMRGHYYDYIQSKSFE